MNKVKMTKNLSRKQCISQNDQKPKSKTKLSQNDQKPKSKRCISQMTWKQSQKQSKPK